MTKIADYINRAEAGKALNALLSDMENNTSVYDVRDYSDGISAAIDALDALAPIDITPMRRGHWIETEETNIWDEKVKVLCCSACGCFKSHGKGITVPHNYCPNCGAKMDKEAGDG